MARSPMTSPPCSRTPTSPGTRNACWTGASATGNCASKAGLPVNADFDEFYRDFEWMGVQRHIKVLGHLRPPLSPRRQGRLPQGHAAGDDLPAQGLRTLHRADAVCCGCWTSWKTGRRRRGTVFESHDPRRRTRRTHASAHRQRSQALAASGRQAADRVAHRKSGACRDTRTGDQPRSPRRTDRSLLGRWQSFRSKHPLFTRSRKRWKQRAASPMPCPCSVTSPSWW